MCLELTIAFAIARRIPLIFSRVSGRSPGIACAAAAFGSAEAVSSLAGASAVAVAVEPPDRKLSMSSLTIRPFLPEPGTALMSTPFSRAYLRTEGIAITLRLGSTSACAAGAVASSVTSSVEASSLASSAGASS